MSEFIYLDAAIVLKQLREHLPGYTVTASEPSSESGSPAVDVAITRPDATESVWSMVHWLEVPELHLSFGSGSLRAELEPLPDDVAWLASVVLATDAGRYTHKTSRWRDRLEARLPDGTVALFQAMPGTPRRR